MEQAGRGEGEGLSRVLAKARWTAPASTGLFQSIADVFAEGSDGQTMDHLPPHILLSAEDDPVSFVLQIGGAVLGLIAVVVVGWFAIVRIRAWMHASEDTTAPFTLDDLRRLHREGKLSEAEFQRAREAIIGAVRSQKGRDSTRPEGSAIDPMLARQIEAERRTNAGVAGRDLPRLTPRDSLAGEKAPSEARPGKAVRGDTLHGERVHGETVHGEIVVRRPDVLRPPSDDRT